MYIKGRLFILNILFKSAGITFLFILGFTFNLYANKKGEDKKVDTINYKITVVDSSQNTPLAFVVLILKKGDEFVNVKETNHFGTASFNDIEEGSYNLTAQLVGYMEYSAPIK